MTAPTLGVLITYHNERELLRDCVASFLAQDPPPDEILIHDDASTAPAEAYLPDGFHGTILHATQTRGPARARNALWRASRCDYIHFHDADDIVLPGWSARVHGAFAEGVEVIFTEIQSRRGSDLVSPAVLGLRRLGPESDLVRFCLRGSMLVPSGTYRRALVGAIGGYRESLWQAEDFDFHVRLAERVIGAPAAMAAVRILAEPLVEIRLRAESRSTDAPRVWSESLKALELLATELPARYADDLSESAAWTGSMLFRLGADAEAHRAFARAAQWGTPEFAGQGRLYRWIARGWGPERAESLARAYRHYLPQRWREGFREWSAKRPA